MADCKPAWQVFLHVLCDCSSWCVSVTYVDDVTGLGAVVAEQFVPFGFCFMRAEISEVKNF